MKKIIGVFNGSTINRNGMICPIPTLESSLSQSWNNPTPSNIGHDVHRPVAAALSVALYLQPGFGRLCGEILIPENEEEDDQVVRLARASVSRRTTDVDAEQLTELLRRLGDLVSERRTVLPTNCVAVFEPGLAAKVFPRLFASRDKDGLTPMCNLHSTEVDGIFERDGFLLLSHPYLRRSLSRLNTINAPLLRRLNRLAQNEDLTVKVALDEDLVGLAGTELHSIELQYCWGPHFTNELLNMPLGVTRHETRSTERFFNGVVSTEFRWYLHNQRKIDEQRVFECEELRNEPSLGISNNRFGCRFVHSMLAPNTNEPVHLDGAIRMYDEMTMLQRLEQNLAHAGRHTIYTKLWRLDGPMDASEWKAVIHDYFRDNNLVGEYFGGKQDSAELSIPNSRTVTASGAVEDAGQEEVTLFDFVPSAMMPEDGVRIAVSYHKLDSNQDYSRSVFSTGRTEVDGHWQDFIEADALDFIKFLRRNNLTVTERADFLRVAYEDSVLNMPPFMHSGSQAHDEAQQTLTMLREFLRYLSKGERNRTVAFHVGFRLADREVVFSHAAHLTAMILWLENTSCELPRTHEDVGGWSQNACQKMHKLFGDVSDVPPIKHILQSDGTLRLGRTFLSPDEYSIINNPNAETVSVEFAETDSNKDFIPFIRQNDLQIAPMIRLKRTRCSRCASDYAKCPCIKTLDNDVIEEVLDFDGLELFWTKPFVQKL